jgi:hypothetical protein
MVIRSGQFSRLSHQAGLVAPKAEVTPYNWPRAGNPASAPLTMTTTQTRFILRACSLSATRALSLSESLQHIGEAVRSFANFELGVNDGKPFPENRLIGDSTKRQLLKNTASGISTDGQ